MKVIVFSNLFPNPQDTERGIFIKQTVDALGKFVDNTIVSPLPWVPKSPWLKREKVLLSEVPYKVQDINYEIFYPKYFMIPKISGSLQPLSIALRTYPVICKIVKLYRVDLIHAHYMYPDCIAAVLIAKKLSIPIVVSAQGSDINVYTNILLRRLQIKWALRQADAITTVSNSLRNKIIEDFRIPDEKVSTIRTGINTKMFYSKCFNVSRGKLEINIEGKYLLFVGRLHKIKGIIFLIDALAELKKSSSLSFDSFIIGEGPQRKIIAEKIELYGLSESVRLLGNKPYNEIPTWMNACNVFCLPSFNEGTPNVLLEALACQMTIVATNVGGIPEIIDKNDGILVPPGDSSSLANALKMAFSTEKKNNINTKAFSWDDCAEMHFSVYRKVLNSKLRGTSLESR